MPRKKVYTLSKMNSLIYKEFLDNYDIIFDDFKNYYENLEDEKNIKNTLHWKGTEILDSTHCYQMCNIFKWYFNKIHDNIHNIIHNNWEWESKYMIQSYSLFNKNHKDMTKDKKYMKEVFDTLKSEKLCMIVCSTDDDDCQDGYDHAFLIINSKIDFQEPGLLKLHSNYKLHLPKLEKIDINNIFINYDWYTVYV